MSKFPQFINDLMDETLKEYPEVPTRTLAKRIYNDHKKFFQDIEQVRGALRRRRGNNGKASKMAKHKRANGEPGWTPEIPPSLAHSWVPHVIEGPERIAIISDIHLPFHSKEVLEQWLEDCYEYEPSIVLINGDLLDFYRLSRFEKNPNERDTVYEIDQAHLFFEWLTDRFEADIIFKEGNHDERWRKYLFNHAPEFSRFKQFELSEILELDEFGITYITDQRMVIAGDMVILHGHEMHGSGGQNPAQAFYRKMRHSGMAGHNHKTSEFLQRNTMGDWIKCYSTGCMCELSPEFSRINNWNQGYGFIELHEDGTTTVTNKEL